MNDISTDIAIIDSINNFPVGKIPTNREELLCKASLVSYLSRFQDQFFDLDSIDEREETVRDILEANLHLDKDETIPSLDEAKDILHISLDSIDDFAKIQQIKEQNENFNETFNLIANVRTAMTQKTTTGKTR